MAEADMQSAQGSGELDEALLRAISHPLRHRLLGMLDGRTASPNMLARELDLPLGRVSYHIRLLADLGAIELVRTEPRRGALEHFYRATMSPWLSDKQLARLPVAIPHKTVAGTLAEIAEAATEASERGGYDGPEAHVSRVVLAIVEAGRPEIAALLDETRAAALRINAASAAGQAEQGGEASSPVATELALTYLRQAAKWAPGVNTDPLGQPDH